MDRPRFEYRTLECPFRELESALVELGSTGWHVHHVEKRTPTLSESAPRYEALYEVLLVRQTHADTLERAVLALAERIEALENKQALHKTEHAREVVERISRNLWDREQVIGPGPNKNADLSPKCGLDGSRTVIGEGVSGGQ